MTTIAQTDFSACAPATNEDLWQAQDQLALQWNNLSVKDFENLEKASGQTLCPRGLLADANMRPFCKPLDSQYDTTHIYFSSGIAELELNLMSTALRRIPGLSSEILQDFVNAWRSHQYFRATIKDFNFKVMAGQVLICIPILRFFLDKHLIGVVGLSEEVASFQALDNVVSCLQQIKRLSHVPISKTRELADLQKLHYEKFQLAYDLSQVKPKHHYALHVPSQIDRFGFLFDCFALERKHQLVKAEIENFRNFSSDTFEASMLARMNELQTREALSFEARPHLGKNAKLSEGDIRVSKSCQLTWMSLKATDVFFFNEQALLLHGCCQTGQRIDLLVEPLNLIERPTAKARLWRSSNTRYKLTVKDCFAFLYLSLIASHL